MTLFGRFPVWPRTLGSRLFLIFLAGLVIAQALSFAVLFSERYGMVEAMLLGNLDKDVRTAVALMDRLPASERQDWIAQLDRRTYRYIIGAGDPGIPDISGLGAEMGRTIREAIGERFPLTVQSIPGDGQRLQAHITLSDGQLLTIDVYPSTMPLAKWLPYVLLTQLSLLVLCSWFAVRVAIRPLVVLAKAADALNPNTITPRLSENGPKEVAYAALAFNAMRDRISHYLEERVQILAAISHDLQTPITRMKLRAEFSEDSPEKDKLVQDLAEIQSLVHEGIAYARSSHGNAEKSSRIDIGSFVDSLAYDYEDTGKAVSVTERIDEAIVTRPHALRRILTNLIDNALKFGGGAEICVHKELDGRIVIDVLDRGAGIPDDQLEAVLQPFFRLEQSRNRGTGGTGLGLAIAQQLAVAIGGSLRLSNREGGGLLARVSIG